MAERGLRLGWVRSAVLQPEWTEPEPGDASAERRFARVADFGGRTLRVVCVETDSAIRIITAMFDRGARREP